MKIQWEPSVYVGNAPVRCAICGDRAHPIRLRGSHYLLAVVYNAQGQVCGEVCRPCIAMGVPGIQERLQERINHLQTQIQELQALAAEPMEVPSLEEEFNSYSTGAL
ncbi:hypothetical protein DO97_09720 [Neosynechococcus sphagnicola sy1]|uniref:Uncharacterized protein n=1 Tax=Neosynechococcus sphagnicola sy1 TaxID=1497020 RepID=A0A098TJH9_9CYAN|nr:hypothetical protein DO97_09720 [Neosynechococcus sphagnicola sy1]